ncbi:MAG: hypothetical protein ACE5D8_10820, partial [Fidelibacterota bacterium]
SRDIKNTEYKLPVLSKIPFLGKKIFTNSSSIEKKTDLIIQITPTIVKDHYSGIMKNQDMLNLESKVQEEFEMEPAPVDTTQQEEN